MTAVLEPPEGAPTLEELASTANNEHLLALESGTERVRHAVLAGRALLAARQPHKHGEWLSWLNSNWHYEMTTAYVYMRLAAHEHVIDGATSIGSATRALRGTTSRVPKNLELREEAQSLRDDGLFYRQIADVLGVSKSVVNRWLNPEYEARCRAKNREDWRRRQAAKKALERQERNEATQKALKVAPDAAGRSHEAATKMDQWLGQWREQATSGEQRIAINNAHALRDQLMEAINEALRLGYVS